jgi:benzoylformate decarboxylase
MSQSTGADLFVSALETYGVRHVFGNPGTTELPFVEAVAESDLAYRLGLHEDIAVGMAAGYAVTKRYHAQAGSGDLPLGVVNLHVAPGLVHGLANLNEAKAARIPLLVTAGKERLESMERDEILERLEEIDPDLDEFRLGE